MAETAAVLGKNDETRHYVELAGKIKEAFHRKRLDRKLS